MRITFLHDWSVNYQQELDWQDGLSAALHELRTRGHEVKLFVVGSELGTIPNPLHDIYTVPNELMVEQVRESEPDVILHWADFTRPNAKPLKELGIPMALCFAGGETNIYNTYDFDHVFVESQVYKNQLDELGVPCSIAFGTNTDLFKPLPEQPKTIDALMVGTFAAWKRHYLFADAVRGFNSLAVGYKYDDHETECWQECQRLGTVVLPHASADVVMHLYATSKVCVVPSLSSGGSQRTVLEAMAMNIPLIVTDSDKYDYVTDEVYRVDPEAESIRGALKALLDGERSINTRDHVLKCWSHVTYADALEEGLSNLL